MMTRRTFVRDLSALALGTLFLGCSRAEEPIPAPVKKENPMPNGKTLIVVYSWSGNTLALAKHLATATGAEVFELKLEKPYTEVYSDCTAQAKRDIAAGLRPALTALPDLTGVSTVLIGSPNWWGTVAPPVSTFLENPALAGKQVALFQTHGGGGLQRCFDDFKKQAKGTVIGRPLYVSGSRADRAADEAARWVKTLGL